MVGHTAPLQPGVRLQRVYVQLCEVHQGRCHGGAGSLGTETRVNLELSGADDTPAGVLRSV